MFARLSTLALLFASAQAFPGQPGSCDSPVPVQSFHLMQGFVGGTELSNFDLEVRIDGNLLDPAAPFEVMVGREVSIEIKATSMDFRGFLARIAKDGLDTTSFLESDNLDENVQELQLCTIMQVGSLAHTNNDAKSSIKGTIQVDDEMDGLSLEVTVVIRNSIAEQLSEWYTSAYTINVVPFVATSAPTPAPTSATNGGGGGGGFACFPGDAVAQVQHKGNVAMKDLQLGDSVLTDANKFEPIYSFGHADAKASGEFLQLKTSTTTLEMTKDHMVFVEGDRAVPASSINLGDTLIMESGELEAVKTIKEVVRRGAFAPFTPSGSIVVNGVKSSSFVAFQDTGVIQIGGFSTGITYQWVAYAAETPHRVWCHYLGQCKSEQYTAEGISTWVAVPHQMALWFVNQNALVMAVVSVPVVLSFAALWMVDVLMAFPMTLMALLVAARFFSVRVKKDVKL